jgi:hypothetical protein
MLVASSDLDLHEAVDGLQADAVASGLVDEIGQDAVQAMMSSAFAAVPFEIVTEPDIKEESVSQSTLDAADYVKTQGSPDELRRWLSDHRQHLAGIRAHWQKRGR